MNNLFRILRYLIDAPARKVLLILLVEILVSIVFIIIARSLGFE